MPDRKKGDRRITVRLPLMGINIRILVFAVLVGLTAVLLRPVQLGLQERMETLKNGVIGRAEEFLGRKVQYGSMGPSIFGVLDIRNVRVLREDDSVFLNIARLRFSFSIIELLKGNVEGAFNSVRVDRPVLSLDLEKDADLTGRLASLRAGGGSSRENTARGNGTLETSVVRQLLDLIPERFSLRLWNGEWDFQGGAGAVRFRGIGLDASVREDRVTFQGRWNAEARLAEGKLPEFLTDAGSRALMSGRISGEYLAELEEGSGTVTIPSVTGDFFRLTPVNVSFFLSGNRLEIRKAYDRFPATFSLVYDIEENRLQGRLLGENFSPKDLITFTGPWEDYNSALALNVSGFADFERESSGALRFAVDFSGAGPGESFLEESFIDIDVSGSDRLVTIDAFDIRSPFGNLAFQGGVHITPEEFIPAAPSGLLSLSNFRLRGERGISGDFFLTSGGRETLLSSTNLTAGDSVFSALDISVNWEEGGMTFAASTFRPAEAFPAAGTNSAGMYTASSGGVRSKFLSLSGSTEYGPQRTEARLLLDSFSAGDALSLLEPFVAVPSIPAPAREVAEVFDVSCEAFISAGNGNVAYSAPLITAAYGGLKTIPAEVSISGENRRLTFSGGRVFLENGTLELDGSVDYSAAADISFNLGANFRELAYVFDGNIRNRRDIDIRGSNGLRVYLTTGEDGIYSGYASADNTPLPSGDMYASLNFFVSVFYDSPSLWRVGVDRFEISGISTPASNSARLRFSGAADERGLAVPNLFYDDGRGPLAGTVTAGWDSTFDNIRFRAAISADSRDERYDFDGTYRGGLLSLTASGREMQLSRFSKHNAVAEASAALSWKSIESFRAEAEIPSLVLYTRNKALHTSARITMDEETFLAEALKLSYAGVEMSVPYIRVSRAESLAETEARIGGSVAEKPLDISLRADARFSNSSTWTDLFRRFEYLDGSLTADTAAFDTIRAAEPFSFTFNSRRGKNGYTVNLSGGPKSMLRLKYASEAAKGGVFYAALSAPSPIRGTFTASIDNAGTIDAQTTDLYADLGSLWRFVPSSDVIAFPGGFVTASVRVRGPVGDPYFYGTARGTSVQILIPEYLAEPVRPVPVTVRLDGDEMTFGPVDAVVGRGGGTVSGRFTFDRWIPDIFDIDIAVAEEHPVPYDLDISGVLANGVAWGTMVVSMDNRLLSVRGDLTAHETEISLDLAEFGLGGGGVFDAEDDQIPVVANLSIKAGRRAEFFWPSVDLPVIQAYAEMGSGINITTDTLSRRFTLTGDVKLRGGEIFYLERNFYLREGTLFLRENETQVDPRISARADIRDQADIGPVTVSMIIDNAPLRSFSPRFTSNPPLSQLEIYSLLGQVPQTDGEQRNLAASVAMDSLTQFTVINRLQRQVRNYLGLDMLSFRTQLLQNVVSQISGGQLWNNDAGSQYRAGNYFDNSTIFFGKYFGSDIFVEGIIPLKYDEYQTGWGGLIAEPEIGLEMRNPLFDIRFNMLPINKETLFIDGVSFSFIWRRSF